MEEQPDLLHAKMISLEDLTYKALSNDLIFDCISSFLSLDDLKQFRLVCVTWRDISDAAFKKRVRICLDLTNIYCNFKMNIYLPASEVVKFRVPPADLNAFFRASQSLLPFTAVKFGRFLPWTISTLTEFFSTEGKYITDLVLQEVNLKSDEDDDTCFDHRHKGDFHLINMLGGFYNLEKLKVDCSSHSSTRFILSLDDLSGIAYIELKGCVVELTDCRITPKELEFSKLFFMRSGKRIDSVLLNDFVNFTLMEKLIIPANNDPKMVGTTKIKLNFSGSEKIKYVKVGFLNRDDRRLHHIADFENSLWEIDTLDLYKIPFQQTNNMIIRDLCISRIQFSPHHFPQSLQKLQISADVEFPKNLQWNFSLPNLKILDLTGAETIHTVFPHLLHSFSSLVELKLKHKGSFYTDIASIDLNMIPPRVQKMRFAGTLFDFVGNTVRIIQTLVLKESNLQFAIKVCNRLFPNNLVVFVKNEELKADVDQSLIKALPNIKICDQGIIFGLFDLKNTGHKNEDFAFPSVDIPGEFYS